PVCTLPTTPLFSPLSLHDALPILTIHLSAAQKPPFCWIQQSKRILSQPLSSRLTREQRQRPQMLSDPDPTQVHRHLIPGHSTSQTRSSTPSTMCLADWLPHARSYSSTNSPIMLARSLET